MDTVISSPRELKRALERGENIAATLREQHGTTRNSDAIIECSYDLQAGSYQASATGITEYAAYLHDYGKAFAAVLKSLGPPASLLEAGVGEATTFASVLGHLDEVGPAYGFDLSWSRTVYARRWLERRGLPGVQLCTGNLFQIPMSSDAVDIVYTSHSIEPNGGNESRCLSELYRVCRRYLILLEPGYELASREARSRMRRHGYCRGLVAAAEALGMRVVEHRLFDVSANPLNPTAMTVIEKRSDCPEPVGVFACPQYKTPLSAHGSFLYSSEGLCVYPVIEGVPCLRTENAILASAFEPLFGARD